MGDVLKNRRDFSIKNTESGNKLIFKEQPSHENQFYEFVINKRHGLADNDGNIIIDAIWDEIDWSNLYPDHYRDDTMFYISVRKDNHRKVWVIDNHGNKLLSKIYDCLYDIYWHRDLLGFAVIERPENLPYDSAYIHARDVDEHTRLGTLVYRHKGVIDMQDNVIIEPVWFDISVPLNGDIAICWNCCIVERGEPNVTYGEIGGSHDAKPCDIALYSRDGLIIGGLDGVGAHYRNWDEAEMSDPDCLDEQYTQEDYFVIRKNRRFGVARLNGELIERPRLTREEAFSILKLHGQYKGEGM